MASDKVFRLVPTQGGIPVADPWRFWIQGAELYAAPRVLIAKAKVSVHSRGPWQLNVDQRMRTLERRATIRDRWSHALSIHWIVFPGASRPTHGLGDDAYRAEFGQGTRLVVQLLLAKEPGPEELPDRPEGIVIPWATQLRDGRRVALLHLATPLTETDLSFAEMMLPRARQRPVDEYDEVLLTEPQPGRADAIVVVPALPGVPGGAQG